MVYAVVKVLLVMSSVLFASGLKFSSARGARSMRLMSTAAPTRVVLDTLPRLYVYDHCPFCVRVRLAFGLKNIKHEVRFVANDDVATPTKLVGKKVTPILELPDENFAMPESLDIIAKIDSDPKYGPTGYFKPFSPRIDLKAWQKSVADMNRKLQRSRYMMTVLPEFAQQEAKEAFVFNHAMPPYEKSDWKNQLTSEQRWELVYSAYEDSLALIDDANKALVELDQLIYCEDYCTEGGLSYDDIDLWARLRSMTLVKGLVFPEKLGNYMKNLSKRGDLPLYTSIAC